MTPCGRIYAVYRFDERSVRYTAWRRRTCNTDSVNIPSKIRTVHADSVACTMLARLQHSVSVLSACATRTQYRGSFRPFVALRDVSCSIVKAPYRSSLDGRRVVRLKVQVPVCVRLFTVNSSVKFSIGQPSCPGI